MDYYFTRTVISDFSNILSSSSKDCHFPYDGENLSSIIKEAYCSGRSVALRCQGNSQGGQSIPCTDMVFVDIRNLEKKMELDPEQMTIECSANVTWKDVLSVCIPANLSPFILPLNTNLSVAGTLAVGGIGSNSFAHGIAASHVKSLHVIDGTGQRQYCDKHVNPLLFYASLSNLNNASIIESACLYLKPFKKYIHSFNFLFSDISTWLSCQQTLCNEPGLTHMQGSCNMNFQGLCKSSPMYKPLLHWFYGLQVSFESDDVLFDDALLPSYLPAPIHYEYDNTYSFLCRYDSRFEMMAISGMLHLAHPWVETILPLSTALKVIPMSLSLMGNLLGDNHRLFFIDHKNLPDFFGIPFCSEPSDPLVLFGVLPAGIPEYTKSSAMRCVKDLHNLLVSSGGVRYLSGYFPSSYDLRYHFGNRYSNWRLACDTYNPASTLSSHFMRNVPVH